MKLRWALFATVYTLFILCRPTFAQQGRIINSTPHALIFSATAEYRHDSIPTAIQVIKDQAPSYNIRFDDTEDQSWFKDGRIYLYDGLIFLDNTGEVLDDDAQAALQNYVNLGGNFIGIHAASDALRNSTFYGRELGAHFDYHPDITNATINVIDNTHPSTIMLPAQWHVFDEMYNFKSDPRAVGAVVILSADESSYTGVVESTSIATSLISLPRFGPADPGPRRFNQGSPHPTAWYQEHGAGIDSNIAGSRSWYTSLGHTNEIWRDSMFISHVMAGISWALQSNTTNLTNPAAAIGSGQDPAKTTQLFPPSTRQSGAPGAATNTPSASPPTRTFTPSWYLVPITITIAITVGKVIAQLAT